MFSILYDYGRRLYDLIFGALRVTGPDECNAREERYQRLWTGLIKNTGEQECDDGTSEDIKIAQGRRSAVKYFASTVALSPRDT